ncbi:MAG: hypothetical protein HC938_15415, partial [Nitrospira sp.]|nr:hypothetical protein [Nitrospira sp.]
MAVAKILLEEQLIINRELIGKKNLTVAFDAGWSSIGWNANECTVVMFDVDTGFIGGLGTCFKELFYDSQGEYE